MSSTRTKLKKGSIRFSKFTVVGFFNAVVDLGTLNVFLWLASTRDPSVLALYNGVALLVANVNSYMWNTRWTFRSRAKRNNFRQRALFALQVVINIAISNTLDRKSTRLNSSHANISYAVFCLKKKKT